MLTLKKIYFLLTPHERKVASLLLIMIFIMALLDTIGVASILPFMAVLANPELIETNLVLNNMFRALKPFGVENNQQFLFSLGIIVFITLITSLAFKAITTYAQVRFVQMREYSIGKRLIEEYLHQPYSWFLNRHSADLGKTILSEISQVVAGGINPLIELIAKGMITIALILLLIVVDSKLALIVGLTLGVSYGIIYKLTQNYLNRIGEQSLKNNQLRFTAVSEAFGAAKEVKVGRLEQIYVKRFSGPAQSFAKNHASSSAITQLPRFALEAIAFGGIILVILYLMRQTGSFASALPIISLYAFAGYRLMPALQQIYASLTQLTFVGPSLNKLYEDLKNLKLVDLKPADFNQDKNFIFLKKEITLKDIYYQYPNTEITSLKGINLKIHAGSSVGIVGKTGSGKTTTVDIILGLLEPQKGTLEIDGQVVKRNNLRAWQKSIGYVPQQIYLSDDTVASNIAFGVESENIDQDALMKASKIANLHNFVMNELPKKYDTTVGERGIRLSGGQKQRIGIARALYHNPKILIFDEATSALDNLTEKAVMEATSKLGKDITVIMIAHRLSTVKNCDLIFLLENGKLKTSGTFEELVKNDTNFSMSVKNI